MPDLRVSDFAPGQEYGVAAGGQGVTLRVDKVQELPQAVREAGGFRLELIGPEAPMLPQATYALERDGEIREIFLVPVARSGTGTRYEAIFN